MERTDVAIVGAGLAGLGLAARLRQTGHDSFVVLDRADEVGGTWRANTYPGVCCDIPSHLYSFSWAPNPDWTRRYPAQPEILRYIRRLVAEQGLREHLRLNTDVTGARFDAATARWRIRTAGGTELEAKVLIPACGQLSVPHVPRFEGLEEFGGERWHSAGWNHDFDLYGKRVAVIGSGASAIQIVPAIADRTARLHVFQRTPPWVIRRADRPYTRAERRMFAAVPAVRRAYRSWLFWRQEAFLLAFRPGSAAARAFTRSARWRMESQVSDPDLRRELLPHYPIGCKRVLISDDYYPVFSKPGVELVTEGIDRFVPEGIRTRDGRVRELDAVVFATGFKTQSLVAPMRIEGPDGRSLEDRWADGPQAHLGLTVAGMPNLFILYGPNTNLGHNSIIFMLEAQIEHVLGRLDAMRRRGADTIAVRPEVMERFNAELQEELRHSIWNAGCTNWYKTDEGRITLNWSGPASA
jgi:cation diffusion facilitator CzcD-associated flavoprotein CzcO